jgi:metallo-beta-lactamase family protein
MHEIEVEGRRYLMDCGMRQGRRAESYEVNKNLPFRASEIEAVLLSHAHIDHSGNLPTLVKNGFRGAIHATPATRDLCEHMLADTAFLQMKDAEYLAKRFERRRRIGVDGKGGIVPPLYEPKDAEATMERFREVRIGTDWEPGPGVSARLANTWHMLGSTHMLVTAGEGGRKRRVLFSGDLGRANLPILKDPEPAPEADYLILESTYGNRVHQPSGEVGEKIVQLIERVMERGGHIVAPAFAVGRTQQLVLMLHELTRDGRIPPLPIFVDSPLAVNVTEVFREHEEEHDVETSSFTRDGQDPFGFGRLRYIRSVEESKALNDLRVPYLVISASGMAEGGRVVHHLRNSIEDPRNMVLITGFQAEHTLGRKLVERHEQVNIFGEPMRLRAEVATLNELSGHADQEELMAWVRPIAGSLKRVFLVHGEPVAQQALAARLESELGLAVESPARGDSFEIA